MAHLSGALTLLLSKDHVYHTPMELTAVHVVLGVLRLVVVREFDKAERLGPLGVEIRGNVDILDFAEALKRLAEISEVGAVANVADQQ